MTLTGAVSWAGATIWGWPPRIAPLGDGGGAGRFDHAEWGALLARFVDPSGTVDYHNFQRVRRLLEAYLARLARAAPDAFASADEQLAFYLNAYNAIVVHQVVLHYPITSIRQIAHACVRPYLAGSRNLSLHLLHAQLLRAFGALAMLHTQQPRIKAVPFD